MEFFIYVRKNRHFHVVIIFLHGVYFPDTSAVVFDREYPTVIAEQDTWLVYEAIYITQCFIFATNIYYMLGKKIHINCSEYSVYFVFLELILSTYVSLVKLLSPIHRW